MNSLSTPRTSPMMRILSKVAGARATRREGRAVNLGATRRLNEAVTNYLLRTPRDVTVHDETRGGVPVVRFSSLQGTEHNAKGSTHRTRLHTVLYIHGGAYVMGSAKQGATLARLSTGLGAELISVEYRLAPEHPFPAAVDDVLAVYRALAASTGVDRLLVVGESAGGGLALLTLQRARDEGLPLPAGLVTSFPWVDLSLSGRSTRENLGKDMLTRSELLEEAGWFVGNRDPSDPLVSPLFRSFQGFPRTYIPVGTHDLLLDDARRVAAALRGDGVEAILDEFPGAIHGFTALPTSEGRRYRGRLEDFMRASFTERNHS